MVPFQQVLQVIDEVVPADGDVGPHPVQVGVEGRGRGGVAGSATGPGVRCHGDWSGRTRRTARASPCRCCGCEPH